MRNRFALLLKRDSGTRFDIGSAQTRDGGGYAPDTFTKDTLYRKTDIARLLRNNLLTDNV